MRTISTNLGSIYSSLDLRLDKFESSVTRALEGFNKLQTGTTKASSIMDKNVSTSVSNIGKSYDQWNKANEKSSKSILDNANNSNILEKNIKSLDAEVGKAGKTLKDTEKQTASNSKEFEKANNSTVSLTDKLKKLDEGYEKTNIQLTNVEKSYKLLDITQDKSGKSIFDNSKKIEVLKEKTALLDVELKKHQDTLKEVEKEYGKDSKEVEEYKSKILDLKMSHADLTEEIKKAERETGTFAGRLELLGKEFEKIDKKYEVFDKVGDKFTSVGNKLTMGITLPIVGAGTAATKFAMDFGTGMAKVSTIADTTKVPIENLKKGVIDLSNKTGASTKELNEALYETLSAGVDTAKSVEFLDVAVKAAKGGFTDTATAVDGLTTTLNSYGLAADEADKIANQMLITQNLGKTTFGELASAVGKVTPIAAALGVTTEELFSSLASTTAQGLATAESVTALKAAMSNIIKPSTEATKAAEALGISFNVSTLRTKGWMPFLKDLNEQLKQASPAYAEMTKDMTFYNNKMMELEKQGKKNSKEYKELSKNAKATQKEMKLLAEAADSPIGAFATMFGSVEGLNSVLMLTSDNGMKIYNESVKQMKENTGALDDAYNKMAETTEVKFNKALNKAKNSAMELGVKLLPTVEKGIDLLGRLADWFGKLSPATQEWVIKIGLASAALGPFLSLTGGTLKIVNELVKLKPKVSLLFEAFGAAKTAGTAVEGLGTAATVAKGASTGGGILGLGSTLASVASAAGPLVLFTGAVAGAGYGIYKLGQHLTTDAEPKIKIFDKNVSNSTQMAVSKYLDMNRDVGNTLKSWQATQSRITGEMVTELEGKLNNMHLVVTGKTNKISTESVDIVKGRLAEINQSTNQEGIKLLQGLEEFGKSQENTIKANNDKILAIHRDAANNNRQISVEEKVEIERLMEENKKAAIKILSDSEIEQLSILNRLKQEKGSIEEIEARDSIARSAKNMTETIAIETEKHNKLLEAVKRAYPLMSDEEKKAADAVIAISERTKKEKITNAETMHAQIMKVATNNGERLTTYAEQTTEELIKKDGRLKAYWRNSYYPEKFLKYMMSVSTEYNTPTYRKNISSGGYMGGDNAEMNASGTRYFRGGFTTMHERGYELYNLPQGTRIWNHQASEALARETAKQVAQSVLSSFQGTPNMPKELIVPIYLDKREMARAVAPLVSQEISDQHDKFNLAGGRF